MPRSKIVGDSHEFQGRPLQQIATEEEGTYKVVGAVLQLALLLGIGYLISLFIRHLAGLSPQ